MLESEHLCQIVSILPQNAIRMGEWGKTEFYYGVKPYAFMQKTVMHSCEIPLNTARLLSCLKTALQSKSIKSTISWRTLFFPIIHPSSALTPFLRSLFASALRHHGYFFYSRSAKFARSDPVMLRGCVKPSVSSSADVSLIFLMFFCTVKNKWTDSRSLKLLYVRPWTSLVKSLDTAVSDT